MNEPTTASNVTPHLSIRPITKDDQDVLWDLLYIALWDAPDEPRRPRSVLENPVIMRLVENWGRPDDFGIMAVDPETRNDLGAIWARLDGYDQLDAFGCEYPVLGIAVFEDFQDKGVGSFLMKEFIESLKPRLKGLRLGVHPKNFRAQKVYKKLGFVEYAVGHGDYPQMKLDF